MKRQAEELLDNWYSAPNRKPLIIWGARQVGKTYLVKDIFAKKFKGHIYIDLKKDDESREFFSTTCDAVKYLRYIEGKFDVKPSKDVPLIFDEVQQCPEVISALKYFCQDFPDIPVIATGSMVRLAIKHSSKNGSDDFLFPVGKVDSIDMFPMTFEEYLMNTNETLLDRIRGSYAEKRPMEAYDHELALNHLYEYLSVGGLPEAMDMFLRTHSYVDTRKVIASTYSNYLSDMDSYNVSHETILKTRNVYENIFPQLNKTQKNFKVQAIDRGKSNRDYFNAYQWLELARIVHRSRNTTGKVSVPLRANESSLFRLYLADECLFLYQSKIPQSRFFAKNERDSLSGIFFENYVATELVAKGIDLFYWTGKSNHEFEFVVQIGSSAVPIDVKKSKGRMNSLEEFRKANGNGLAIKISANNYGFDETSGILTIPLYQTFLLADDIAKGADPVER